MVSVTNFTATDSIFNGEDYTRAQLMYVAPVPVPAAVWLFVSGIIDLSALTRSKKRG